MVICLFCSLLITITCCNLSQDTPTRYWLLLAFQSGSWCRLSCLIGLWHEVFVIVLETAVHAYKISSYVHYCTGQFILCSLFSWFICLWGILRYSIIKRVQSFFSNVVAYVVVASISIHCFGHRPIAHISVIVNNVVWYILLKKS